MTPARRPVAVLGATGVAGHQALAALAEHPWFEIAAVASSARTAGRRLGDVLAAQGEAGVRLAERLGRATTSGDTPGAGAGSVADLVLLRADSFDAAGVDIVFSALPADVAREVEARCAATTPVLSTASAFRMEPDTPLLLAGVNPDHAALLDVQRRARGWAGFVAPGPNCTTVGLAVTLAPLIAEFGVRSATLVSLQALSGAGAGASDLAARVDGNVLVHIEGEEEKVEHEAAKILGRVSGDTIAPAELLVSASCTRVAVADGHTLVVHADLARDASPEEVVAALRACDPWSVRASGRALPSAPERWIDVRDEPDRPQPRLDAEAGGGLTTVVGRIRRDPVTGGVKYVVVSHNAVIGAAGGAVLLAEDLVDRGLIAPAS